MGSGTYPLVGLFGTFVGYLFAIWRNRMVPWIALIRFSESRRVGDNADVTDNFTKATSASWFMDSISSNHTKLGEVSDRRITAKKWIQYNEDSDDNLEQVKGSVKGSVL